MQRGTWQKGSYKKYIRSNHSPEQHLIKQFITIVIRNGKIVWKVVWFECYFRLNPKLTEYLRVKGNLYSTDHSIDATRQAMWNSTHA